MTKTFSKVLLLGVVYFLCLCQQLNGVPLNFKENEPSVNSFNRTISNQSANTDERSDLVPEESKSYESIANDSVVIMPFFVYFWPGIIALDNNHDNHTNSDTSFIGNSNQGMLSNQMFNATNVLNESQDNQFLTDYNDLESTLKLPKGDSQKVLYIKNKQKLLFYPKVYSEKKKANKNSTSFEKYLQEAPILKKNVSKRDIRLLKDKSALHIFLMSEFPNSVYKNISAIHRKKRSASAVDIIVRINPKAKFFKGRNENNQENIATRSVLSDFFNMVLNFMDFFNSQKVNSSKSEYSDVHNLNTIEPVNNSCINDTKKQENIPQNLNNIRGSLSKEYNSISLNTIPDESKSSYKNELKIKLHNTKDNSVRVKKEVLLRTLNEELQLNQNDFENSSKIKRNKRVPDESYDSSFEEDSDSIEDFIGGYLPAGSEIRNKRHLDRKVTKDDEDHSVEIADPKENEESIIESLYAKPSLPNTGNLDITPGTKAPKRFKKDILFKSNYGTSKFNQSRESRVIENRGEEKLFTNNANSINEQILPKMKIIDENEERIRSDETYISKKKKNKPNLQFHPNALFANDLNASDDK